VIVKTNLTTHKTAHVVLFSSDITLGYEPWIDSYRLRFQLEFNFRALLLDSGVLCDE
jgi:hypothetical protein